MGTVDEWRSTFEEGRECIRKIKKMERIAEAITEVQLRAAHGTAETSENLHNSTVTRSWMPLLFNGMVGMDANADVKRMALEAADETYINQIYPEGATLAQWDAFIADYKLREALWIRDNPRAGKSTGGRRRQPAAGAATPVGCEIGCPPHMRGWVCPNEVFDLAATGCVIGSHNAMNAGSTYASEDERAKAKRDYPNNRGNGKGKGKGKGEGKGKAKAKAKARATGAARERSD
jgi:hypothetical protein